MISTGEYIIGDVNGNGIVNSADASSLLSGLDKSKQTELFVRSINHSFKDWFPKATCASTPDANEDMMINKNDADDIMKYYAKISSGKDGYLNISKIDTYETFSD